MLVHLIPRLYDTTSGNVLVGDKNVKSYDLKVLGIRFRWFFKNTLFSGTVAENLRWGNENATNEEMKKVCKIAADEFIENKPPKKYEHTLKEAGQTFPAGRNKGFASLERP